MTEIVKYKLLFYNGLKHFKLGDKEFVYVHLTVQSPNGERKEMNFQTFTKDKWEDILDKQVIELKENVAKNIMVGDYYS